jgi:hypothetical protein
VSWQVKLVRFVHPVTLSVDKGLIEQSNDMSSGRMLTSSAAMLDMEQFRVCNNVHPEKFIEASPGV